MEATCNNRKLKVIIEDVSVLVFAEFPHKQVISVYIVMLGSFTRYYATVAFVFVETSRIQPSSHPLTLTQQENLHDLKVRRTRKKNSNSQMLDARH